MISERLELTRINSSKIYERRPAAPRRGAPSAYPTLRAPYSRGSPLSTVEAAEPPKSRDLRAGTDSVSLNRDIELASSNRILSLILISNSNSNLIRVILV